MPIVVGEVDAYLQGSGKNTRQVVGVAASRDANSYDEFGVGGLMPWGDRLWFLTYPNEVLDTNGIGLWSMGKDKIPRLERESGACDNGRIIANHKLLIGRWVVSRFSNSSVQIRDITGFDQADRITAWAITSGKAAMSANPSYAYALTMGGKIYRVNVAVTNPVAELIGTPDGLNFGTGQPHGKGMWGHPGGRYLLCAFNGDYGNGRLAWFDTETNTWDAPLSDGSWLEVAGSYDAHMNFWATGHDNKSALLWMFNPAATSDREPRKFRLPFGYDQQIFAWQQEWQRIRAVETERFLMLLHGQFYFLSMALTNETSLGGRTSSGVATGGFPRIEPISRTGRTIPDFTTFDGHLVLAGNQTSPGLAGRAYPNVGQPNSSLLFLDSIDDLWAYGSVAGKGFWYRNEAVASGVESEPMLMKGFGKKVLHLHNGGADTVTVRVSVYFDHDRFEYKTIEVPAGHLASEVFEDGFAADWVSIAPMDDATAFTAGVIYS